jgi:hypothetical protein
VAKAVLDSSGVHWQACTRSHAGALALDEKAKASGARLATMR